MIYLHKLLYSSTLHFLFLFLILIQFQWLIRMKRMMMMMRGIIDDKVSLIGVNKINEFDSSSPTNDFHPTHDPDPDPHPTSFTPPIIS